MTRTNPPKRQIPRILRRASRILIAMWALVVAGVCFHLWWDGWFLTATERLATSTLEITRKSGLAIQTINLAGRTMTSAEDILDSLGVQAGDPILSFSPELARQNIEKLSWVKTARVQRKLPDTLFITITERKPYALWQYHQKLALVDEQGEVLERDNLAAFRAFKIVVGEEAAKHARDILPLLAAQPEINRITTAATLVGGRRWDLLLRDNITVKLPEKDAGLALARLADLQKKQALLDRQITAIDLRLPGRISVQVANTHEKPVRLSEMGQKGVKTP